MPTAAFYGRHLHILWPSCTNLHQDSAVELGRSERTRLENNRTAFASPAKFKDKNLGIQHRNRSKESYPSDLEDVALSNSVGGHRYTK